MSTITFTVPGPATTKGSMRAVNHSKTGRAIMMHSDPKHLAAWIASIKLAAIAVWDAQQREPRGRWSGNRQTTEAVHMTVRWHIARPKSHYGTGRNAGKLKTSAPRYPTSKRSGDIDKLERALLDALTGIVYVDDSQVVTVMKKKRYAIGTGPQMVVSIEEAGLGDTCSTRLGLQPTQRNGLAEPEVEGQMELF